MSETILPTHTPGPWQVSPLDGRTCGPSRLLVQSGTTIAQMQAVAIVTLRTGETDANARLIAAAPELLAALKSLLADIDAGLLVRDVTRDGEEGWSRQMIAFVQRLQAAQAAIWKVEGVR